MPIVGSSLGKDQNGTALIDPAALGQISGLAKDLTAIAFYGEFVGTVSGTVLTVTAVNAGALAIGGVVFSPSAGWAQATILTGGTGTGGTGTYNLSATLTGTLFTNGAVAQERANIANNGTGVWQNGEKISPFGQTGTRTWTVGTGGSSVANAAASHARNVTIGGITVTLPADSNIATIGTGAPSSGFGNNGDLVYDPVGIRYYTKAAGVWSASAMTKAITGATAGTVLVVDPANSYVAAAGEIVIRTINDGVPAGGNAGQVLVKLNAGDYGIGWRTLSGSVVPNANYYDAVLTDAPVGFWQLNDSDNNAVDASGNAHTATGQGTITRLQGLTGAGGSQSTLIGNSGGFLTDTLGNLGLNLLTTGCTIEFVFKGTSTAAIGTLFGVANTGNATNFQAQLNVNTTGVYAAGGMTFLVRNESNIIRAVNVASAPIFDGNWHHVVMVIAPNTTSSDAIYIDGAEVSTYALKPSAATAGVFANFGFPMGLCLGNARGTLQNFVVGQVGGMAIYNKILSAARVLAHKNALVNA